MADLKKNEEVKQGVIVSDKDFEKSIKKDKVKQVAKIKRIEKISKDLEIKDEAGREKATKYLGDLKEVEELVKDVHDRYSWIDLIYKARKAVEKTDKDLIKEIRIRIKDKISDYLVVKQVEEEALQKKIDEAVAKTVAEHGSGEAPLITPAPVVAKVQSIAKKGSAKSSSGEDFDILLDYNKKQEILLAIGKGELPLDLAKLDEGAIKRYIKPFKKDLRDAQIIGVTTKVKFITRTL